MLPATPTAPIPTPGSTAIRAGRQQGELLAAYGENDMAVDTAGRTRAIGQAIRQDLRAVGASARILADEPPDGAREGPERRRLEQTLQRRH